MRLVFPRLSVSQEAALTHMDVHTFQTTIPENTIISNQSIKLKKKMFICVYLCYLS